MRRVPIDAEALGITPEDLQTAARVAVAMHAHAVQSLPNVAQGYRNQYAAHSTIKTLLEIGGVRSPQSRVKEWKRWLYAKRRCTVIDACAKWDELGLARSHEPHHGRNQYSVSRLREMSHEGLIRYFPADKGDPGVVIWIGEEP